MPVLGNGAEDLLERLGLALGPQRPGLLFALRAEHVGLLVGLGVQDRGLPQALGAQDRRLLLALGLEHGRPLGPVGPHLLLHRLLDRPRRVDRLQLDAGHAHAPLLGCLVEHRPQLRVDRVAARERLLERHRADHVSKRRDRELLHRLEHVGDLVRGLHRVGDLVVDDGVDADRHVVLGDHGLRRERLHGLLHVDHHRDAVEHRHEQVDARADRALVAADPLDDADVALLDHPHGRLPSARAPGSPAHQVRSAQASGSSFGSCFSMRGRRGDRRAP